MTIKVPLTPSTLTKFRESSIDDLW